MSEGLAQGSYVMARVGFEPATFHTQGTQPTTESPRLINIGHFSVKIIAIYNM